jgi:hypothetical protein
MQYSIYIYTRTHIYIHIHINYIYAYTYTQYITYLQMYLFVKFSSHQDLWRARLGSDGGALWEQLTAEGEA